LILTSTEYTERENTRRISHAGTVVPECFKDDNASQGKSGKFAPSEILNRSSPKCAWVITSGTPTPMQNYDYPFPSSQISENAHQVTRLVFLIQIIMGSSATPYLQVTWPSQILDQKSPKGP